MSVLYLLPWKWKECYVTVSPSRALVVWKIRYFSKINAETDYLASQKFHFLNATWRIDLYPSGDRESRVGEFWPYLSRVSSTVESQNVKCKFFYRDKFTDEYLAQEFVRKFNENKGYGPTAWIKREDLMDGELRDLLLAEDTLTVCCEVRDADAGEPEDPMVEILNRENVALRKSVSDFKEKNREQAGTLADVLERHTQVESRVEILNRENVALRKSVSDFEEKNREQAGTLADVLERHTQVESRVNVLNRDNDVLRKSVSDFEEKIREQAAEMECLRGTLTDVIQRHTQVESSGIEGIGESLHTLKTLSTVPGILKTISAVNLCQLALYVIIFYVVMHV